MKYLVYFFITGVILCLSSGKACSQEIVSCSGGSEKCSTGTISYTLGELVISTGNEGSKTLTQGFHQSKITVTTANETARHGYCVTAFPNPASDLVILQISGEMTEGWEYRLIGPDGKMLLSSKITDNQANIPLGTYSRAMYFIKVTRNGNEIKTFRILKQ
jgi:hypothetical protein